MPVSTEDLLDFAGEVRRLEGAGEPPLYPAYKRLLEAAYGSAYRVDTLLRTPGAGFPDFTISRGPRIVNWVEVKHPGVTVDPLPAADGERFDRYRAALPHIVLTNGWCWRLFERGEEVDRVVLPREWLVGAAALTDDHQVQLRRFLDMVTTLTPSVATTYDEAVRLLAVSARLVEAAVLDTLSGNIPRPLSEARESFVQLLRTNPADPSEIDDERFADVLAQTCVFGYLLARVEAGEDVTPDTAATALDTDEHPFLKTTLYAVTAPDRGLEDALRGVLRTACDAINAAAPRLAGPKGDWDQVPYVYEPFFALYKPDDRFQYGVFYTPEVITRFQVQEIQAKLRVELGLRGLTDPSVRFLDPCCGTGTYLLALAEEAVVEADELGLPVATTLRELFRDRVVGFEVSPGPATVAQARLTAWLRAHGARLGTRFPVYVVNTLSPPAAGGGAGAAPASLWAENITNEQKSGDEVKRDKAVLVVFGNPPWGDRPRATFATGAGSADNIIGEWARGTGAAVINLYDLYVAFWRFALGMLLERPEVQEPQGIVSFITNRSWLRGRAYRTMREWIRTRRVQADLVDLGGDVRAGAGADDEPVFSILAGSAIATLTFVDSSDGSVTYRRVRGSRRAKFDALRSHVLPPLTEVDVEAQRYHAFGPIDWGPLADAHPISDFFSGNFPGVKTHRDDLVINVSEDALLAGLRAWNRLEGDERMSAFHATGDRPCPVTHVVDPAKVMRHRYRPLDDRHLYGDRDFIDRPGRIFQFYEANRRVPALVSMDTRTSAGPVLIATPSLPGYNSFRGSYETHVFPLAVFSDPGQLNVGRDLLSVEARRWASPFGASALDVGHYLLALGNAPLYADVFAEALESDIVRFPAVADQSLFWEIAAVGKTLMAAWNLEVPPIGRWVEHGNAGLRLGAADIRGTRILFENGDRLEGIHPHTSDLSVSGYPIMKRYLEAREHLALSGEFATETQRVAAAIGTILDARDDCDALLERAIAAPSVSLAAN